MEILRFVKCRLDILLCSLSRRESVREVSWCRVDAIGVCVRVCVALSYRQLIARTRVHTHVYHAVEFWSRGTTRETKRHGVNLNRVKFGNQLSRSGVFFLFLFASVIQPRYLARPPLVGKLVYLFFPRRREIVFFLIYFFFSPLFGFCFGKRGRIYFSVLRRRNCFFLVSPRKREGKFFFSLVLFFFSFRIYCFFFPLQKRGSSFFWFFLGKGRVFFLFSPEVDWFP